MSTHALSLKWPIAQLRGFCEQVTHYNYAGCLSWPLRFSLYYALSLLHLCAAQYRNLQCVLNNLNGVHWRFRPIADLCLISRTVSNNK